MAETRRYDAALAGTMGYMRWRLSVLLVLPLLVAGACSTTGSPSGQNGGIQFGQAHSGPPVPFSNWPTYHRTNSRHGHTTPAVHLPLRPGWQRQVQEALVPWQQVQADLGEHDAVI